jgi:hypothetical protein
MLEKINVADIEEEDESSSSESAMINGGYQKTADIPYEASSTTNNSNQYSSPNA